MKVILKHEVDNLGLPGDVVDVTDGYGRNFLLPRGLAILATRGALKEAETLTRARKVRESKTVGTAEAFSDALQERTLRIPVRVDDKGHLYGSVSAADVQRVLKERGHDVERRRIDLRQAIKQIGSYPVVIRLHPQVSAEVQVEVVDVEGNVTPESLLAARAKECADRGEAAAPPADDAAEASDDATEASDEATGATDTTSPATDGTGDATADTTDEKPQVAAGTTGAT